MDNKNKELRIYTDENGEKYQFDCRAFKELIAQQQVKNAIPGKKVGKSKAQVRNDLANSMLQQISPETVKGWQYGTNGPENLETIKNVADYFDVEYHELLTKLEDKNMSGETNFMDTANEMQKIATRERVRDVYEALMEAIEKAHRFYYREYYDFNKSDLIRLYEDVEYEDVEAASERVGFLLWKYMLDIPTDLRNEIFKIRMTEVISFLEDTIVAFLPDEDYKEVRDELSYQLGAEEQLKFNKYIQELFGEYIVK